MGERTDASWVGRVLLLELVGCVGGSEQRKILRMVVGGWTPKELGARREK